MASVPLSKDFNSSVVRLKVINGHGTQNVFTHFNSSVVRLKVQVAILLMFLRFDFNSSVVRLKECTTFSINFRIVISIPVWCD